MDGTRHDKLVTKLDLDVRSGPKYLFLCMEHLQDEDISPSVRFHDECHTYLGT